MVRVVELLELQLAPPMLPEMPLARLLNLLEMPLSLAPTQLVRLLTAPGKEPRREQRPSETPLAMPLREHGTSPRRELTLLVMLLEGLGTLRSREPTPSVMPPRVVPTLSETSPVLDGMPPRTVPTLSETPLREPGTKPSHCSTTTPTLDTSRAMRLDHIFKYQVFLLNLNTISLLLNIMQNL